MAKRLRACNSGDIKKNKILLSWEEVESTAFAVAQLTFLGCQSGNPKSSLFLWAGYGEQVSFFASPSKSKLCQHHCPDGSKLNHQKEFV